MFYNISDYLPYGFALVVAIPFLVLLRQFVYESLKLKKKEIALMGATTGNEMRIQAFERMTLFMERIKPSNIVARFDKNLAVHEFVFLTDKAIKEEFEYNASQQLYISTTNWQNIMGSKEKMLKLLHATYEGMGEAASLEDFKTVFLMNYVNENDFIGKTIDELKKELLILNFNS